MTDLRLRISTFKSRFKVRYPIILIFVVALIFVIPYFFPYNQAWRPYRSIDNEDQFGHSLLRDRLKNEYSVSSQYIDITREEVSPSKAIIIIAPELAYKSNEIDFLRDWVRDGGKLLVFGSTTRLDNLLNAFGYNIERSLEAIFDFSSEYGSPSFLETSFAGTGSPSFVSVTPYSYFAGFGSSVLPLQTNPSAENGACVKQQGVNCNSIYNVGAIDPQNNFGFILDNWMLSNEFIESFFENYELVSYMLDTMTSVNSIEVTDIIFDESHYQWAPLNKKGVEVTAYQLRRSEFYIPIIGFVTIVLPFLMAFYGGVFINRKKNEGIAKKLYERIDRLYLDKIIAVPFTIEEQFLTEEKLELELRSGYYFQFIAHRLLETLFRYDLIDKIDAQLIIGLKMLGESGLGDDVAWELIKAVNKEIKSALDKPTETISPY